MILFQTIVTLLFLGSLLIFAVSFPVAIIAMTWTVKSNSIAPVYRFPELRETACTIFGVSGAASALLFFLVCVIVK